MKKLLDTSNAITLAELAKEMDFNKSKLVYYHKIGLLKSACIVGKTLIFDAIETKKKIQKIEKLKDKNKSLDEIKVLLNK